MTKHIAQHPPLAGRGSVTGRVLLERQTIHVTDATADQEVTYIDAAVESIQSRVWLGVPLLRDGEVIGVIILLRNSLQTFSDRQIDLVTTFANQAVTWASLTRCRIEPVNFCLASHYALLAAHSHQALTPN